MKLAMIGSYGHAGVVLDGAAELDDVELVAAARWGEDDPLSYVGRHPAAPASLKVYDDYRRMLTEAKPDLVGVFMPLYRNAEAALAAVEQGCHVISEKPLATKLEDFDRLKRAVEQAGVTIGALMTMRGESAFQAVRDAVAQGKIGHPVLASGQKSYPFANRDDYYKRRKTYGGSILWQAIHALDFIHYTTGRDYTKVAAMNSNACHPTHPGMEDNGGLLLELSGGGHAVVWFDYLRPWSEDVKRRWGDDRLRIAGTDGILEVVDEGTRAVLMTPTATEELPLPKPKNVFVEFVNSLTGRAEGLITPAESFRITEVALKARDAADKGEVVEL
ncbi:MAG: Gfo/Idh/MocA family protein [Phycisphaerae bacterium]